MLYTISSLREKILHKVYGVYEIFSNFFGEEFTDLQNMPEDFDMENCLHVYDHSLDENGQVELSDKEYQTIANNFITNKFDILIHWPTVTVTNEYNRSVEIQDLFAKVQVTAQGLIPVENKGFELTRSTFTKKQFTSGYIHSHIPRFSGMPTFKKPCLGTGPINGTITDLKLNYDEVIWMLFCQELAVYVTVESLTGVPYIKLEDIGKHKYEMYVYATDHPSSYNISGCFNSEEAKNRFLREFTLYYIDHGHLAFNYKNGEFVCGLPFYDFMVDISNAFIEWFNQNGTKEQLEEFTLRAVIVRTIALDGKFYRDSTNASNRILLQGNRILTFKGRDYKLVITDTEGDAIALTTLLNVNIAEWVLQYIIKIINYRYRNEHTDNREEERASSRINQNIIYI